MFFEFIFILGSVVFSFYLALGTFIFFAFIYMQFIKKDKDTDTKESNKNHSNFY